MKKLLSVLGVVTLAGTGVSNIVACHTKTNVKKEDNNCAWSWSIIWDSE